MNQLLESPFVWAFLGLIGLCCVPLSFALLGLVLRMLPVLIPIVVVWWLLTQVF